MSALDFSKKSVVFITGASRGIGRAIAIGISQIINPKSAFVLIASSETGLNETKSMIKQVNSNLSVVTYPLDLSNPSSEVYEKIFDEVLGKIDVSELYYSIFIHNAGTVGVLKKTLDITDVDVWRKYYDLNIISTVSLNTNFVKKTKTLAKQLVVVNISSLCGRAPFINMSMYGSVKAARELFFKVFAAEEPDIIVLNYSPGPVDTDMFGSIIETAQDEGLRKTMTETKNTVLLKPEQTVGMMLTVLQKGDFKSGDCIDYFDRV